MKIRKRDSTQESALNKAVKNVTEILKKKEAESKANQAKESEVNLVTESKINLVKESNVNLKAKGKGKFIKPLVAQRKPTFKATGKGLIYLGHIPHGFYEDQMADYFKQFGDVIRVRVSRSKKTGKSRGYGYVEFINAEVAKIAAETMNNYLMHGRLMKAEYIPPEKQHRGHFRRMNWSETDCPKLLNRKNEFDLANSKIDKNRHAKTMKRSLKRLSTIEKKLKSRGINLKLKFSSTPDK
ncbi:MKI67 FHA domain-interacting nucleolar phosphoprotein-like [Orussus abietinus]|uniref:MKI67 FHA domain-interacting nucleolar phosphoprotein-like n=1 Tax=Orussus abietinus TaxID=222816 RepID=UPI0006253303|nr:MKI67 FHA domain-interacting nucleolar phosphoprotein-like [Orussus abietinus]